MRLLVCNIFLGRIRAEWFSLRWSVVGRWSLEQATLAQVQRQLFDEERVAVSLFGEEGRQIITDIAPQRLRRQSADIRGIQSSQVDRSHWRVRLHTHDNRAA